MTPTADSPTTPDAFLLMGVIGKAHGIGGEVKVRPETDDPARFETLDTVYIGKSEAGATPRAVEGVRFQTTKRGLTVVLRLEGAVRREDAELLRGLLVFAHLGDLPPLDDDEFFLADLIGLDVVDADGTAIGQVHDVLETAAHEVLVVTRAGQPDAMIPLVDAFIDEIDFDAGHLVVRPIEGLLE